MLERGGGVPQRCSRVRGWTGWTAAKTRKCTSLILEAEEHAGRVRAWLNGGGRVHEGQVDGHLVPTPYQAKGLPSDCTTVPPLSTAALFTGNYYIYDGSCWMACSQPTLDTQGQAVFGELCAGTSRDRRPKGWWQLEG